MVKRANPPRPLTDAKIAEKTEELGRRVALARQQANLTQVELGERSGVHFMTISRLERATQTVSVSVLWKVAHALNMKPGEFLD